MRLIKYPYHALMIKGMCQMMVLAYFHKDCKKCDKSKNNNNNNNDDSHNKDQ